MSVCFLMGHRDAPPELLPRLVIAVERHVTRLGVAEFVVGTHGHFDRLAAQAVRAVKARHPAVRLTRLLACYRAGRQAAPEGFDGSLCPDGMETVPKRFGIVHANRWMIAHCDYLIAYDRGFPGNTREIVKRALARERKGLMRVENLGGGAQKATADDVEQE